MTAPDRWTCGHCGKVNWTRDAWCESCGRKASGARETLFGSAKDRSRGARTFREACFACGHDPLALRESLASLTRAERDRLHAKWYALMSEAGPQGAPESTRACVLAVLPEHQGYAMRAATVAQRVKPNPHEKDIKVIARHLHQLVRDGRAMRRADHRVMTEKPRAAGGARKPVYAYWKAPERERVA